MTEVQLRTLRVSAEMDSSQYVAGARDMADASRTAVAAVDGIGTSVARTDARISQSTTSYERLKRQFIEGYSAARDLENRLQGVSRGLERGAFTADQAARAVDGIIRRYGLMADASQFAAKGQADLARAIELSNERLRQQNTIPAAPPTRVANDNLVDRDARFRRQNLGYQLFDIGQSASLGMPLAMIAAQQGPQIAQLYAAQGGLNAAMKDFGVILGGLARVAGPFIGALAALYAGYRVLESNSAAAALAVSDSTRALADQAAPLSTVRGMVTDLQRVQQAYNDAILATASSADAASKLIIANTEREFQAKKLLLDIELKRQEAAVQVQESEANIAGLSLKQDLQAGGRNGFDLFSPSTWLSGSGSNPVANDPSRLVREGYADPAINGGIPFVKVKEEISGIQALFDRVKNNPLAEMLEEAKAKAELARIEFDKLVESSDQIFNPTAGTPTNGDYWDRYSRAQLAKQRALQNPVPTLYDGSPAMSREPAGARADIQERVKSSQALIQSQREEAERLQLEVSLIGASARQRAELTAGLQAEIELRRRGIGVLSEEGKAYIAKAQAMAVARVETERLNGLQISRDPAGARSNVVEQVKAFQSLSATQQEQMAAIQLEARLIGATAKERAVMTATLQAEQTLRRQGISILSEEGRAYIANAKAMAEATAEIQRQNQLSLSREPAGARADIVSQVQARQQLFQGQADEMEKLRLEASLVGASAEQRARATAALQAEQELRQRGIGLLSQEGQLYIANAQAMASARQEIERQNAAYASLQQAGGSAIDSLTVGTGSLRDRLKSAADTMLQWVQQMTIANPLKNAMFGSNLPTMADMFSGRPSIPGATSTGMMTVTAGTVMVNGGIPGASNIPGLSPSGGGLADVLGYKGPVAANTNTGPFSSAVDGVNALRNPTAPTGNIEAYIRSEATRLGMDPNTAVRVAQSEGGLQSWNLQSQYYNKGVQEQSYGPFQLYKGGGLGNDFQRQTGLDPALAVNGPQATTFALEHAKQNGWGAFHGAKRVGIGPWDGINPGVDPQTTNSTSAALKQLSSATATASKDVSLLGNNSQQAGQTLGDVLGGTKLPTGGAFPPAPTTGANYFPPAPTGGGNIFSSLFGGIFKLFGFADGTDFSPGGTFMVGERGREIVTLPRGSQVTPTHKIGVSGGDRMRGGPAKFDFNINVGGNGDKELMERMRIAAESSVAAGIAQYHAGFGDYVENYQQNPHNRGSI